MTTKNKTKASPLPWRVVGRTIRGVETVLERCIARTGSFDGMSWDSDASNAALIVRRVNEGPKVDAALRALVEANIEGIIDALLDGYAPSPDGVKKARAALALAADLEAERAKTQEVK